MSSPAPLFTMPEHEYQRDEPVGSLKEPSFLPSIGRTSVYRNHLRPCPLLDNPADLLKKMVHQAGAYPTQLGDLESVDDLTSEMPGGLKAVGQDR